MVVGKSRDGVPTWSGDPSTWDEYRRAALLFVETTKWSNRYLCGPRLAAELSGAAKASIVGKKSTWLSHDKGVHRLLQHLQEAISEPVLPEVGNALRTYFKSLRRKRGESMTGFCVRHREEYEKACRALTRMMGSQKPDLGKNMFPKNASRRSSWGTLGYNTSGPERPPGANAAPTSSPAPAASASGPTTDSGEAGLDTEAPQPPGEDSWETWARENRDDTWSQGGHSSWSRWGQWSWHNEWSGHQWQAEASDTEDEEPLIEVLPDVIKGWLLLEKAGLDTLEKSIIQSDIKSQFTLLNVENSLRAHWTDEQIRRRDGETRAQANFEDFDDEDDVPQGVPSGFFENWDEEDVILFQSAQQAEADAWAQIQQGRRTLREARERQKEVRLGRKFYTGKGQGKFSGASSSGPARGGQNHSGSSGEGPCLRCGKAHSTRNCPQKAEKSDKSTFKAEVDAESEFIFYAEAETLFGDSMPQDSEAMSAMSQGKMTTQQAMKAGYGVLDPGATRTMGSIEALEHARSIHMQQHQQDNITSVNTEERPTFGFADSKTARCSSTVLMQMRVAEQNMKLRVHALDKGSVPVLFSIDSLRRMGAIVDYSRDEAVFVRVNPSKRVKLQTTMTGHQILPLTRDFMQGAADLQAPIFQLGAPISE